MATPTNLPPDVAAPAAGSEITLNRSFIYSTTSLEALSDTSNGISMSCSTYRALVFEEGDSEDYHERSRALQMGWTEKRMDMNG